MGRRRIPDVEEVTFNGVVFRRYPSSPRRELRVYFMASGAGRLHQEIWRAAHGAIPPGHEVHHRDGNPLNNALENLECLSAAEHARRHEHRETTPEQREGLARARVAARAWHASAEGRAWHAEHARRRATTEHADRSCTVCGQPYVARGIRAKASVFCSKTCKAKHRRDAGVDDVDKRCAECGVTFRSNRYDRTECCSKQCGRRRGARLSRERAGLQPHR